VNSNPMKFCYNQIISKGRELSNNERNPKSNDDSKQLKVGVLRNTLGTPNV